MTYKKPYPSEVRERAVRMVFETQDDYPTQWGAIRFGGRQDRLLGRGVAQLGPSGRDRHGRTIRLDDR